MKIENRLIQLSHMTLNVMLIKNGMSDAVLSDEISKTLELIESIALDVGHTSKIVPQLGIAKPKSLDVVVSDLILHRKVLAVKHVRLITRLTNLVTALVILSELDSKNVHRGYGVYCKTVEETKEVERIAEGREKVSLLSVIKTNMEFFGGFDIPKDIYDNYPFLSFDLGENHGLHFMFSWVPFYVGIDHVKITMEKIIAENKLVSYSEFIEITKGENI